MNRRQIARSFLNQRFKNYRYELWKCYKTEDEKGEPTAFVIIGTYVNLVGNIEAIAVAKSKEELKKIILAEPTDFKISDYDKEIAISEYKGHYIGTWGKNILEHLKGL